MFWRLFGTLGVFLLISGGTGFQGTAFGQVPIPLPEQVELFNSLPPAQRQQMIRELQGQLPPAQRTAVVGALQGQNADMQQESAFLPAEDFAIPEPDDDTVGVPVRQLSALFPETLPLFGYSLFRGVPTTFAPATDIPLPVDYVVGPGDTLTVQLFGNLNTEYFLEVSREGVINFPEIGPLNVTGLSFSDVRNLVNERVSEQMIGVRASTTLGELRSIRIFVLGEVSRPGSYTVSALSTMTNALFVSGGIADIGTLRNISLMREGVNVTNLDLYDLLLRGDTSSDARLQPGDVIFVPPVGDRVTIAGEVVRPAIYELAEERDFNSVLALAGGLSAEADPGRVKLERIVPGRGAEVLDLDVGLEATRQLILQNGDKILAQQGLALLEHSVHLKGNVYLPGAYQWYPGMRVTDLISSTDLIKPQSDINYMLIRRETLLNIEIEVLSVDFEAAWLNRAGQDDIELMPRDTVFVFSRKANAGAMETTAGAMETTAGAMETIDDSREDTTKVVSEAEGRDREEIVTALLEELSLQLGPGESPPIARVGGQVRSPGDYPLEANMRISDALRAGGGLSDAAYSVEAELTRYEVIDGSFRGTQLINIDLAAVLAGNSAANLVLRPYDYLNIKEIPEWRDQQTVTLAGEVVYPGTYPIRRGETLRSVLLRAGGLTEFAFAGGSVFTREALRQREQEFLERLGEGLQQEIAAQSIGAQTPVDNREAATQLLEQSENVIPTGRLVIDLESIVNGVAGSDIELEDGDRLVVSTVPHEVSIVGEVQFATSHIYSDGRNWQDYIDLSGGFTELADEKRVYVVRADGSVVVKSMNRWFRRGGDEQSVEAGDTIVVPIKIDQPLSRWSAITQTVYNLAVTAAAIGSF